MEKDQIINAYRATMDNSLGAKILGELYYYEEYRKL